MSELTDSNTGLAMISSYTPAGWLGGWLGGSHLHNDATLWPNLQVRTCKNSSQVKFQVGPSVAISQHNKSYPSTVPSALQKVPGGCGMGWVG